MDLRLSPACEKVARHLAAPLIACGGYFLLAGAVIHLTGSSAGIAPIWLANAVLLALVLLRPRAQAPAILAAGFLGNAFANVVTRDALLAPLLFGIANMVEVVVAMVGLKTDEARQRILARPSAVLRLLLWAGLIAPGVSAVLGGATAWFLFGQSFGVAAGRWFLSDALGLLIFTPFFIALLAGDLHRDVRAGDTRARLEFVGLLALTGLVTAFVFFGAPYPMLFAVAAPLMLVSFRAGWLGTKFALAIVALIGGTATMLGHGPIPHIVSDTDARVYFFQLYLAAMLLTQMPVTAALTARQQLIDRLRESEQSLRLLASRSPVLLAAFDLAGRCQRVVGTSDILLDRDPADLVGGTFAQISEEGQYELRRAHGAALEDISRNHVAEFRCARAGGAWLEAVFRAQFDDAGRCVGTVATIHDVTKRKNQELRLSRSATTDSLTGLLNRAGFRARLEQALLTAGPGTLSIAMIDVDRFKLVNDNAGHRVGDAVLREIAQRIAREVRASDVVARLGGDEFVILLPTSNWALAQDICARVVAAVRAEPVALPSGGIMQTAVSCGVARLRAGLSADEFIHDADLALYQAKRAGRNRVVSA